MCANLLTLASVILIIVTFPLSLLFTVKVVQEYERAVIFRLGRLLSGGASGPGVFFVIPCMDMYVKIDMRTLTYEIPPQEILTRDSVTVFVNAIMYYKVRPSISCCHVMTIFTQGEGLHTGGVHGGRLWGQRQAPGRHNSQKCPWNQKS